MDVQNKSIDQYILVVAFDISKKSKNANNHVAAAAAAAAAAAKVRLRVVFALEEEAELIFNKEHSSGRQPFVVFFVVSKILTESTIRLSQKFCHKDASLNIVFLVDSNEDGDNLLSTLPAYALMGINYTIKICDTSELKHLLVDILRTSIARKRQRTALSEVSTDLSNLNIGQDVIQYQKFETQERYLRSILPMMNIAVIATNSKGKIELWNKKASDYFGIQVEDAVGDLIYDIATVSWKTVINRIEKQMSESSVPGLRLKDELLELQAGNKFYADIYYSHLTSEDGQTIGSLYLIQDVTHMIEVDKAKTEFVSLAAHQLRTPAATISWFAQTLLNEKVTGELSPSQKEYIIQIQESSQRMSKLVNTLLDVSRLELGTFSIDPEKIDPQQLLNKIVQEFLGAAKNKNIIVEQVIGDDFPKSVLWDQNLVQIMVGNLVSNAIKYTPENGSVLVCVKKFEDAALGPSMVITVQDTGYGIPKNQQEKIFTKLFRADNIVSKDTDGTGLGLYLLKIISDHIGARVHFESPVPSALSRKKDPKKKKKQDNEYFPGTLFTLTIPLCAMKSKRGSKRLGE
jgi:PAS domain S-box-containing protein